VKSLGTNYGDPGLGIVGRALWSVQTSYAPKIIFGVQKVVIPEKVL